MSLPPAPEKKELPESVHVELSFDLQPGEKISIHLKAVRDENGRLVARPVPGWSPAGLLQRLAGWIRAVQPRQIFIAALILYLVVMFTGLTVYPAHFSCDEAVSTVNAARLMSNNLRDENNVLLPTFTKNDGQYSLSATVYLAALPYLLLGPSVWVVRAFNGLIALLGMFWLARLLRDRLNLPEWSLLPLLLAASPAWFFLARTGLETIQLAAFYSGFLYYYARYRFEQPKFLFAALLLGGLAFYAYTPGQVIMIATGLILLVADAPYHWRQRRTTWKGALLLIVLALPLARFILLEPDAYVDRLRMYGSYLAETDLTALQKLGNFLLTYLKTLSPTFWLTAHTDDQHIRYALGTASPLPWTMYLLAALGLFTALRGWRARPELRLPVYALLAAPVGAALTSEITLPRALAVIVPLLLLAALGLSALFNRLTRFNLPRGALTLAAFLLLAAGALANLVGALTEGARWLPSYGLDGTQWGAPQVYAAAKTYLTEHPDQMVKISPNWTFQGDTLRNFFAPDEPAITIRGINDFIQQIDPQLEQNVFVLTAADLQLAIDSQRFEQPEVVATIPYPDGSEGFSFVRLAYRSDIDEIIAAEQAERSRLVETTLTVDGQSARVRHSQFDGGQPANLFDGDLNSLARTGGANPLVVEIDFAAARAISGVTLRAGAEPVTVNVTVFTADGSQKPFTVKAGHVEGYKDVPVDFAETLTAVRVRIELLDDGVPEPANVHLWEITFNP